MHQSATRLSLSNGTINASKHALSNTTRVRPFKATLEQIVALQNITFDVIDLDEDVDSQLWHGVAVGLIVACVCCALVVACVRRLSRESDAKNRYEGIPLITIKHGKR